MSIKKNSFIVVALALLTTSAASAAPVVVEAPREEVVSATIVVDGDSEESYPSAEDDEKLRSEIKTRNLQSAAQEVEVHVFRELSTEYVISVADGTVRPGKKYTCQETVTLSASNFTGRDGQEYRVLIGRKNGNVFYVHIENDVWTGFLGTENEEDTIRVRSDGELSQGEIAFLESFECLQTAREALQS